MVELQLENVGKTFAPDLVALDDISFTLTPGECLAILGPSGCGKTTLLRVIAGLERETAGEIRIDGRGVNETPCHQRDVAMLFQRPALIPQQTVRQNMRTAWTMRSPLSSLLRVFGRDGAQEAELVRIAELLGVQSDLDRVVGQLSGGQQQRVALGRCLLRQAKLCLFDEPLGHLDAPLRAELRRQTRDLTKSRATSIYVTHDPEEALAVGDRVAVMQKGRFVQVDEPINLTRAPNHRFVAELMHHSQGGLNVLTGAIVQEGHEWFLENAFGRWAIPLQCVQRLRESLFRSQNSPAGQGKVAIMIGIPASAVCCTTEYREDDIRLDIAVQEFECGLAGNWVIGADARGRWIARAGEAGPKQRGQVVTMTFSIEQAYWFDNTTGRTLVAPTG